MIANKIILALSTFDRKEMKRLEEFLHSPYCNGSQQCIALFNCLREFWPSNFQVLEKTYLLEKLFPNKKGDANLSVLIANLFHKVKKFIILEELETESPYQDHLLQKGLLRRNLTKLSELHFKDLERKGKFIPRKKTEGQASVQRRIGLDDLLFQYLLTKDYSLLYERTKQKAQAIDLQEILDRLDEFYHCNRLIYSYEQQNRLLLQGQAFDSALQQQVFSSIQTHHLQQPLLQLLYQSHKALAAAEPDQEIQEQLQLLEKHGHTIKISELNEVYVHIINHYYRRAIAGDFEKNLHAILDVYKRQLDNRHLYKKHVQFPQRLKNIIGTAAYLKAFDTARAVLYACKNSLKEEIRAATFSFNLAMILFYENRHKEALAALDMVGEISTAYLHDRRFLQLKLFYVLIDEKTIYYVRLESQARSFMEFIRTNKKISRESRKPYKQVTQLLLQLAKIHYDLKVNTLQPSKAIILLDRFLQNLEGMQVIQASWLLGKAKELHATYCRL